MANNTSTSQKQKKIDLANQRVIVFTSIATFVVIFCAISSQVLFSQMLYQNRIASAKKQALGQLKTDEAAATNLDDAYRTFVSTPVNVLGGNSTGSGSQDGDNAKIVLDALPSKYDFPALATSLEKILTSQSIAIQSITGTDDELAQSGATATGTPTPIAMPFQISVTGNYQNIQKLTSTFEASIRPIQIQTMTLSGGDDNLSLSVTAQTYYQPEKSFSVGSKVIK